jgi:hypothetical protein
MMHYECHYQHPRRQGWRQRRDECYISTKGTVLCSSWSCCHQLHDSTTTQVPCKVLCRWSVLFLQALLGKARQGADAAATAAAAADCRCFLAAMFLHYSQQSLT